MRQGLTAMRAAAVLLPLRVRHLLHLHLQLLRPRHKPRQHPPLHRPPPARTRC